MLEEALRIFDEEKFVLIALFIAISAIFTSCFYTVRTAASYNMYISDVNVYTYSKHADFAAENTEINQNIARRWLENANWWERTARRNGFFTLLCFGSIVVGIIAFFWALFFSPIFSESKWKWLWLVFVILGCVIIFITLGLHYYVIATDEAYWDDLRWLSKKITNYSFYPVEFLAPPDRNDEVKALIDSRPYLTVSKNRAVV